jgi:tetratricopeptide (TPR) repeat protein
LGLAHAAIYDRVAGELYDLAPLMPAGEVDPDDPLEKRAAELRAKLAEKDWRSEALAFFREAVRMDPAEAKYWYNLGTTLKQYRPQETREAVAALQKAVELDGTYYPALRNLALSLRREGWLREAREVCLQLQKVAPPDDAAIPSMLADIAFDDGDLADAERHYLRELELDADSLHAHLGLAALYRRQGDLERSLEHTDKAIALEPEHERIIRQSIESDAGG